MSTRRATAQDVDTVRALARAFAPSRPSLASRVGAQIGAACMIGLVLLWSVALALGAVAVIILSWRAIA